MSPFARVFRLRYRGFRVVDLTALSLLTVLVLGVYGFKALAGREGARIADIDQQIVQEAKHVRLLRAELAHLEQPERIERLSTDYLGLQPVSAKREAPAEALTEIAQHPAPLPPPLAAAAVAHAPEVAR